MDHDLSTQVLLQSHPTSSVQPDPQQTQLSHEFQMQSRPSTPENDLPDEEPSSTLASKVIRAQDNPSPPPSVSPTPSNRTTPSNKHRLIDISEPATPFYTALSSANHALSLLSPTWGPLPVKSQYVEAVTPHRDLITFDVGNVPEAPSMPPSNQDEILHPSTTDPLVAEPEASIVTRASASNAQEEPNIEPLLTPVRCSSRGHLDSPTTLVSPVANVKSRHGQQHSQLTRLEESSKELFSVVAAQAGDSAFDEASKPFGPDVLSLAVDSPRQTRQSPPASSRTFDRLVATSPDKYAHSPKPLISNESMSASSTVPSFNLPTTPKTRSTDTGSPVRLQLALSSNSSSLANPPRTPARRMLIEGALLSHTKYSSIPSKPANSGTGFNLGLPRTPVLHIPPTDSPARRVLVSETNSSRHPQLRGPISYHPDHSNTRSQSAEPGFPKAQPSRTKGRSNSVEPLPAKQQGLKRASTFFQPLTSAPSISKVNKLPFPLVAEAIPEENLEDQSRPTAPKPLASSSTSTLKHGASRIPRIGSKPYARPIPATRTVTNTFPGTSIFNGKSSQLSGLNAPDRSVVKPTIDPSAAVNELAASLKRKRTSDDTSSSSKTPTLEVFNPVAHVTDVSKAASNSLHTHVEDNPKVAQQSEVPSNVAGCISLSENTLAGDDKPHRNNQKTASRVEQSSSIPPNGRQKESFLSDLSTHGDGTQIVATEFEINGREEPTSNSEARRTTRTRKKVQSTAPAPSSRSSQSRRKAGNVPAPVVGDVFSGMTAVGLKTLTNANTVRNQQYVAAKLETEVIRKSGCRPTSPTVKVRTVLERVQDDKGRLRRERAQRRAQGSSAFQSSQRSDCEEPGEQELPSFTELDLNVHEGDARSDNHNGHRRGAGEDENYKTPERQLKRLRLTDDPDPDETREGRRVKWNKSLFEAVFIDEVRLGTRPLSKVPASRKGCLALASKAAQLDNMGNLPNANTTVVDLTEENVIVKKYVYDDDEETVPPVAKATRSKSRRSKS